jgi:hypothetical protein
VPLPSLLSRSLLVCFARSPWTAAVEQEAPAAAAPSSILVPCSSPTSTGPQIGLLPWHRRPPSRQAVRRYCSCRAAAPLSSLSSLVPPYSCLLFCNRVQRHHPLIAPPRIHPSWCHRSLASSADGAAMSSVAGARGPVSTSRLQSYSRLPRVHVGPLGVAWPTLTTSAAPASRPSQPHTSSALLELKKKKDRPRQ